MKNEKLIAIIILCSYDKKLLVRRIIIDKITNK